MRTGRLAALATAALLAAAACGEGHAIFNVDIFSFMQNTGGDTLHYTVPPTLTDSFDLPAQKITLLSGASNSIIDTVLIDGTGETVNASGQGTLDLSLFFTSDSASLYTSTPALTIALSPGPDSATTPFSFSTVLGPAFDSLFTQKEVWVGVRISGQNASATTTLDGRMQLTGFRAHIVLQDKVFGN